MRPGPEQIDPGSAPGGLVVQVYDLTGTLLVSRSLTIDDDLDLVARVDAAIVDTWTRSRDVCLVVFDGDSGDRWTVADFAEEFL